ncbi:hypothetical protein [Nocardioides sp.]|uniref:hypothetical protein n=1 Tax=Nocardioides sp. TaxID=35761 RepID=UPI0035146CEB
MFDTAFDHDSAGQHLTRDRPCSTCGHAPHTFLACSDTCGCRPLGVDRVLAG